MEKILLVSLFALGSVSLNAQTEDTVSLHAGLADQVWYSLANGEVGRAPLAEWDLAFEMTGLTAGIRVNTAIGTVVYETTTPISGWDLLNSPDTAAWTRVDNDITRWDMGALNHGNNMDLPNGYNVGWGVYNPDNHHMNGNKVYALAMPDGSWRKLRINSIVSGVVSFTYASIDGTDSHDVSLNKTQYPGRNFAYWSFTTNTALNREPLNSAWDLVFTKYTDFVPTPYNVAGVLQNRNVPALQVDDVPTSNALWTSAPFNTDINVLGSDWKAYANGAYHIVGDTTWFVKDIPGNIWKIVFTGYGGGATGNMMFNKEMVSAVGIAEQAAPLGRLVTWPNPVTNGQAQVILDIPANHGTIRLFNAAGQQVLEQQWNGISALVPRALDVHGLAKGFYTMRFDTPGSSTTGKLIIE